MLVARAAIRRSKPPGSPHPIRGYAHHRLAPILPIQVSTLSEIAVLGRFAISDSSVHVFVPVPEISGSAKSSTLRQLPVSPNSRAEPENHFQLVSLPRPVS